MIEKLALSGVFCIESFLSGALMLLLMTFNFWVVLTIIASATLAAIKF